MVDIDRKAVRSILSYYWYIVVHCSNDDILNNVRSAIEKFEAISLLGQ